MLKMLTRDDLRKLSVVGGGVEVLDWRFYDTLDIANGGVQSVFRFFQQAQGVGGLTKETTNMDIASQLPRGYEFVPTSIIARLVDPTGAIAVTDLTDKLLCTSVGFMSFNIGNRPYYECKVLDLFGGALTGWTGNLAAGYTQARTLDGVRLELSPVIPSNYNFDVTVTYPAAPVVTLTQKLYIALVGKVLRPRQG